MKKQSIATLVLVVFMSVLVFGAAWAQMAPADDTVCENMGGPGGGPGAGPGMHKGKMMGKLAQELNLTEDQKTRLRTLMESRKAEMQALRSDTTLSKEQKMAKFKEMRASMESQIKAILTPEQQAKFDQLKGQMMAKRKEFGKGNKGPGQGRMLDRLAQELNLTETQKSQFKTIMESRKAEMQALRNNTALSQEQKKAKHKEMRSSMESQIKAILSPEQQAKFDELKKQMMAKRKHHKKGGFNQQGS